uniref:Uncharacterized protein n=1 Tax=Glossina austeni TaxID=7395 RepID=A0A1A9V580_GLOAU
MKEKHKRDISKAKSIRQTTFGIKWQQKRSGNVYSVAYGRVLLVRTSGGIENRQLDAMEVIKKDADYGSGKVGQFLQETVKIYIAESLSAIEHICTKWECFAG